MSMVPGGSQAGWGELGIVIRDELRCFVASRSMSFEFVSSPLHSEALAAREGLLLATHRGLQNWILETDSLPIYSALLSPSANSASLVIL
ncbi:hypothetical protein D8674_032333 [Pyrus ussuriensis x Pyrus communis]|uniref:RNase H type-1 domain-containing protein n=1 Tax=Pyrus ussuriensis x Pyrus communis TaxID=2448454 RepID=A0A5N5F298_9ROSA|nr:hypothetical protein D8674_032333 [Pyrus ussuriensis x Pyrus communis]